MANDTPTKYTASKILKTQNILRYSDEDHLSQALANLSSSHDAAFVFDDEDKFIGVVSPYFALRSRSKKDTSKLKSCVIMPPKLTPNSSLSEIAKAMLASKLHFLPVIEDGEFLGIVTITRLLNIIVKHTILNHNGSIIFSNRELITTTQDTTIARVLEIMRDKKIAKLPVVNDSGHLIGMISQFDIRNMVHNEDTRGKFDRVGEQTNRLDDPVKEYMSGLVYTVDHLPKFSEAAGLMLDKEIGSLVIVDKNNSPEGIVTKKDLLQTIAVSNI